MTGGKWKMKTKPLTFPILLCCAILIPGCRQGAGPSSPITASQGNAISDHGNPFDNFLHTEITAADGFDFPIGDPEGRGSYTDKATGKTYDGWYIATRFTEKYSMGIHTGEDWNGSGGGDTDLGQ